MRKPSILYHGVNHSASRCPFPSPPKVSHSRDQGWVSNWQAEELQEGERLQALRAGGLRTVKCLDMHALPPPPPPPSFLPLSLFIVILSVVPCWAENGAFHFQASER